MTLTDIETAYRSGETPVDVVRRIREAIEAWNDPALFIHLPSLEEAEAMARAVEAMPRDLPLWGVPFVVKDNIDVAGMPTTAGCPDYVYHPDQDAAVVRLLREAGAIPIGKVNLDQFATGLVGTRSPHGVPRNSVAPGWLPGGSSSGSASAVAAGLVPFSLGTDTAGSGRVPAAFQELIGWKPTRGLLSIRGVVPACQSLDCVSVFANNNSDAARILEVVSVFDPEDPWSRRVEESRFRGRRIGVPASLDFAGDPDTPTLFGAAVEKLAALGYEIIHVDFTPFVEAAKLLYEGPRVAERWAAVGEFVAAKPDSVFPVTRTILEKSQAWSASDAYLSQGKLRAFARACEAVWETIDFLLLPTTPCLYTVDEVLAEPFGTNATLGRYTNFMNLLDLCALAVPSGRARGGAVPWGVTLAAPAGHDRALLEVGAELGGEILPDPTRSGVPVVVCGAHLEGLPLHWQLSQRGARLRRRGQTAPVYRMFVIPGGYGLPPRPALIHDESAGAAIDVEVWELPPRDFGEFVAAIPAPLGIGKVRLDDGSECPGFIAEPRAVTSDSLEITALGGWKAWLATSPV